MKIISTLKKGINKLIRSGHWFNNELFRDCSRLWKYNTFNTQIVNLGSTSGLCSFSYEGLPFRCANWALGSNPLKGDLAILKNYFSFLDTKGSMAIFPLCPFSSLSGSYEPNDDRYYTILYASTIPHYSYKKHQIITGYCADPLKIYPIAGFFSDIKHWLYKKKYNISEEGFVIDANNWMNGWKHEFSISDWDYPLSMKNNDAITDCISTLNEIISFCISRNIRPVFLIPPVYHTLGELFTPNIYEKVLSPIESFFKERSVWYVNYMNDNSFYRNPSLFLNSFLLNKMGAKMFTQRVLKDLGVINEDRNTDSPV